MSIKNLQNRRTLEPLDFNLTLLSWMAALLLPQQGYNSQN